MVLQNQIVYSAAICLSLLSAGCSGRPEGFVPVSGEFTWEDGSPMTGVEGMVRFDPFDPSDPERTQVLCSTGIIDSYGRFQLMTYRKGDGAPVGHYKVKLFLLPDSDAKRILHPDYEHYIRAPLEATVTADGDNHFKFTVDRSYQGADRAAGTQAISSTSVSEASSTSGCRPRANHSATSRS